MAKRVKFNDAERMDRPDMDALAAEPAEHNQELAAKFLFDPSQVVSASAGAARGFPVSGFKPVVQGAGSAKQLRIDRGVALLGMKDGGVISYGALAVEGNATQIVDLSSYAVDLWGVWIRFDLLSGDNANRILWDPTAVSEYTEAVPTRRTASWSVTLTRYTGSGTVLVSPGPEWTWIGDVDVQAGTIVVYDRRNLFFEGNIPSLWSKFRPTWGAGALDRNDDRSLLQAQGGGGIGDLRTFCQAALAKIGEIQGAQRVLTTDTAITITTQVGSVQTLTGFAAATPANVGKVVTLKGCASAANNGTFKILSYAGSGSYTISNAAGVAADANSGAINAQVKDPLWWEATTEAVVDKVSRLGDATPDGSYHFNDTGGGHTFLIDSLLTTSKVMNAAGGLTFGAGAGDTVGTAVGNGTSPSVTLKATNPAGLPGYAAGNVAGSNGFGLTHDIDNDITRLISTGPFKVFRAGFATPPLVVTDATHIDPGADNTTLLGSSALRWSEVHAVSIGTAANRITTGYFDTVDSTVVNATSVFATGTVQAALFGMVAGGEAKGNDASGFKFQTWSSAAYLDPIATFSNRGSGGHNEQPFFALEPKNIGTSLALANNFNILDRVSTLASGNCEGLFKLKLTGAAASGAGLTEIWVPYYRQENIGTSIT